MATQNLIPGLGFVNESVSKQNLIPGGGFVNETVSAGGSLNVSATTDALTLAEYAATIGKDLNVSANTDSLTLAEHAATVSLVSGLNVNATTDALTLAEHAATIGLSLNVQATTDALTLAEYPASLGSTLDVQATTDALTLAEYPATLSFALNVSATTDSLTLVEYGATIGDGSVAPAAATGGVGHGRKRKKRRVMVDGYVYVVDPAEERALLARLAAEKAQEAQLLEALGDPQTAAEVRRKAFRIARRADMADPYERIRKDDEEVISRFIGLLAA